MGDSEEEDPYQTYEDEWSQGEESYQALTDEEADYEAPPWPGDYYSDSDFEEDIDGEDFEPEPPDYSRGNTSQQNWSGEEETDQGEDVEDDREGDSWHGETESQFSEEIDSQNSSGGADQFDDEPWNYEAERDEEENYEETGS